MIFKGVLGLPGYPLGGAGPPLGPHLALFGDALEAWTFKFTRILRGILGIENVSRISRDLTKREGFEAKIWWGDRRSCCRLKKKVFLRRRGFF